MTLKELHRTAIELVDLAFIQRFNGSSTKAIVLFKEAFEFEKRAAFMARDGRYGQPTESVLFRSAASIAFNAGDFENTRTMVSYGLHSNTLPEIQEEFIELLTWLKLNYLAMARDNKIEENIVLTSKVIDVTTGIKVSPFDLKIFAESISKISFKTVVLDDAIKETMVLPYFETDHKNKTTIFSRTNSISYIFNKVKNIYNKTSNRI